MATFKAILGSTLNNKPKADGTYTVYIRVTQSRVPQYFSISYSVKEKDWNRSPRMGDDGVLKHVRKSHPNHAKINRLISDTIEEMRDKINALPVKTPMRVKEAIKNEADDKSFMAFYAERLEVFKANSNDFRRWKRYNSVYNNLRKFLKGKDHRFDELTHEFVDKYRNHRLKLGRNGNTDFKKMSPILNEAIRRGYYEGPNLLMEEARRVKRRKKRKEALTLAELERLKNLELPEGSLIWHVRNFFILNFYFHGMRAGDSFMLKHRQIQEGRIFYEMEKTEKLASFKIPRDAYYFLNHYLHPDVSPDQFVFPFLSNDTDYSDATFLVKQLESKTALVNKYLRKIAELAEIDKHITTHVARHTFASFARDRIGDISKIQAFLKHSSIRETEIYLSDLTDKSLDESTDEIFG